MIKLIVTAGPFTGREFTFPRHDTFLVGRGSDAHLRMPRDDQYFSRRHFLIEINPPRCRVTDLKSRNHIFVNGEQVEVADLAPGDELKAGHTVFRVELADDPAPTETVDAPAPRPNPVTLDAPAPRPASTPAITADLPVEAAEDLPSVPGYRLLSVLGRGGMGVVYKAVRVSDSAAVAVKTILPAKGTGQREKDRFLREARILAGLDHPHIVPGRDSGEVDGMLYLVMDFIDGTDADRLLKKHGPLPIAAAVRLACQMLDALAYAHGRGFVHRDIKPANLLIGPSPTGGKAVRVADFGLARAYETSGASGVTMAGDMGGTMAYMPPEQLINFRDVQPAADQYSAAATLYHLLANEYTHDLPKQIHGQIACILNDKPVPLTTRRPEVPTGLWAVIEKALAADPDKRYPNATAFRAALAPFGR